ncbi:unnamed protein product [Haemonchus placei]|uniref:Cytochrome c domain-containing protein n=1 Tax=Haemonchus placei TaxID=6290 RepID=A0A0N4X8V1_HAEPC|nr:unnamed protein product [Haemonchus placei]
MGIWKKDKSDSKTESTSIPEGDYERGKKLFKYRCAQCHAINTTRSMAGPTLHGLFGRTSGTAPGYVYSESNRKTVRFWASRNTSSARERYSQYSAS